MSKLSAGASWSARLFAAIQYPLPQHLLSRIVHWLSRRHAGFLTSIVIKLFIRIMNVDMRDARQSQAQAYTSFNEFFTRELKQDARPLAPRAHWLISPVDGTISQIGKIQQQQLLQAKGHKYSLQALLGTTELASEFGAGAFAPIYLAPNNYHRIHMPADGRLRSMHFIPGRLFSVNAATAASIPGLFARNERVACVFDSNQGAFVMVLVGAMFVGSIETVWSGEVTPGGGRTRKHWNYAANGSEAITLARGEEMGRFNMGSTVILLHAKGQLPWGDDLHSASSLRLGQALTPPAQEIAAQ